MERGIGDNSEAVAGDWIALARSTATHWLVGFGQPVKPADPKRGAFSRSEAWIDLIMLARWKPGQENNKGRKVDLDVGQLQGGYDFLSERWNWTVKQVRLFLSKLMGESMIAKEQPKISTPVNLSEQKIMQKQGIKKGRQSSNQIQVITLCNYRKYQVAQELLELEKGQAKGQARGKRGASEGQDLNKETLKQETTQQRAQPNDDVDRLRDKLLNACNGAAAPATAPGILVMSEPLKWLQHGCDLDLDILPTIQARAHKMRPGSVKNWSYFTQAVSDAKAMREAPMPSGEAKPKHQQFKTAGERQRDADDAWLEREFAAAKREGIV